MRSFPSQLSITANARAALAALDFALEQRSPSHAAWLDRRQRWALTRAASLRKQWQTPGGAEAPQISPEYLSRCVAEAAGPSGLIFNEYQLRLEHCLRTEPGSYFALSPAGGLGWSIGAALGAKLAAPNAFVTAVIGDGGMIFANPSACHWVAVAHELPILMVIFNNERYGAVRNATMAMFAQGAAGRENGLGLADLSPSAPFDRYAEAHGAFAARVERPAELASVFSAAREAVLTERRHALINVITPY
jgi:acetolactate synthase-1/2/3 large subunit